MSLVGSLEDLGLGDILQIVSLARKSGRLLLRTDGDTGRIVVCEGLVRGAAVKSEFEDLRGLLVGSGQITGPSFERARELARESDIALDEAVVQVTDLPRERLDALRRERVERAVMRMFGWRTGEFSFEVRDAPDPEDLELLLPTGINTQYLAMEATRLRDEDRLLGDTGGIELADDEEPLFSGEEPADPLSVDEDAVDAMALASARSALPANEDPDEDTQPSLNASERDAARSIAVEATEPTPPEQVSVQVAPQAEPAPPPLVAIDQHLIGLEWLKLCAAEVLPRVHIFQHGEAGMDRVRRYLARGVVPLVVLAPELLREEGGRPSLLTRMRGLSPDMQILALLSGREARPPAGFDGAVVRPGTLGSDPELWAAHEEQAAELVDVLREAVRGARGPVQGSRPRSGSPLERLRSVSDRLRDPGRQGDVLSVVLDFAAKQLARVAIFMLRDDAVVGMAQRGLSRAGGPDDERLRKLVCSRRELPELFERALEDRRGVRGPMPDPESSRLVRSLGHTAPRQAYVAPIESGGCVAALLYGDNLPIESPLPDTTALEIVLHEAGLALDRALLERALEDARAR